jgi:ureidoacrylate peracid hydrolase
MRPTPGRTALLVIDMQNAFCHPQGSLAQRGLDISQLAAAVEPCVALVRAARAAGMPVILTRYMYRPDHADGGILVNYLLRPGADKASYLAAGSWDVALLDELAPQPTDFVVDKNRPSAFYATNLKPILNGLKIDSLIVAGVTTNCCVETTVRDASQRDYKVFVVADATGEQSHRRHDVALESMSLLFADVITLEDALGLMRGADGGRAGGNGAAFPP